MTPGRALFLLLASVLAGAVNAVAGGGTLLSFPAAIAAGLRPIVANATNAVALVPGSAAAAWAFRRHLTGLGRLVAVLAVPAVVGALAGAAILRHTPQRVFDGVIPWLVLGATLILLGQEVIARSLPGAARASASASTGTGTGTGARDGAGGEPRSRGRVVVVVVLQLLVSIYGGYFGAAMGIIMLAFLGLVPPVGVSGQHEDRLNLHQMNALKNLLAVIINGAASIDFIAHGLIRPGPGLVMAAGAIAGGVVGGRVARRAQPRQVRRLIVAIGFGMAALLAWRRYG